MCPLLENAFNSILRKSVLCLIGQGCDTYLNIGKDFALEMRVMGLVYKFS